MLSMDKGVLPKAFSRQFSMAQSKAPALSGPLIVRTFQKYLGKSPFEVFDDFDIKAKHAASIGQVHQAQKDGKKLAVKILFSTISQESITLLKIVCSDGFVQYL